MSNPGSDEALAQGCLCARMDNNRGLYPPFRDPDAWYVTVGCPVHCPEQIPVDTPATNE